MIRTIIFDVGQVLVDFHWEECIDKMDYDEDTKQRLKKATVLSPYWNEIDRGSHPLTYFIEECIKLDSEIEKAIREFYEKPEALVTEFSYAKEWLHQLKENGYGVYLLSNYGREHFENGRKRFQFMSEVDGEVISYQIQKTKPEKEMYEILIKKYNLVPEECIFLDDKKENVEAAEKQGIQGIVFTSYEDAIEQLRTHGVEC
ncbi:HAD superfamily hydrolase [Lachnospiraceae bacterium KM106-2]|nr:HAD superfamily hydrolase [Lachnospiraceae bacterium KM106-2]